MDLGVEGAERVVRSELVAYLLRRAAGNAQLAEVDGRVADACEELRAAGARHWVSVRWQGDRAQLHTQPLGHDGPLPGAPVGPGVTFTDGPPAGAAQRPAAIDARHGPADPRPRQPAGMTLDLGVERRAEASLDPDPGDVDIPPAGEAFLAALMAVGTGQSAGTPEAACALAGAAAARRAADDYRAQTGLQRPLTPDEAVEAFLRFHEAIGGDFERVPSSSDEVVLANQTCPFGAAVASAPHLCRVTSASLGALVAGAAGGASVALDERIAMGDRRCRVTLRPGSGPAPGASHRYTSPPAGLRNAPPAEPAGAHGITLSLRLPRDRLGVPLVRRLAAHTLEEIGASPDAAFDVQLALGEACANVLDHAGDGDDYTVSIAIVGDRCELRIADTGRGFDYVTVRETHAGLDDERGRGLRLMRAVMDRVDFTSEPERGTLVMLVKHLQLDESAPARRLLAPSDETRGPGPGQAAGGQGASAPAGPAGEEPPAPPGSPPPA